MASTASQVTDLNTTITTTFNRGDNINTNSGFDGGMAPFVKTNTGATGGDIVWSNGAGQIGSAVDVTVVQNATQSPGLFANGNRWSGMKAGTGRRMRTVVVARAISGTASITARCRVRTGGVAGEGSNDQTTPNLTTEWQRFQLEHPIGDDRTEVLSHVWVTNRAGSTGPARVLIDRIEFYDITNEVKITANAAATAGLTTTVNQQGSKLDATAQDLVSLKTQVGDVSADGFDQLKTEVSRQDGRISANAVALQGVQVGLEDKADAAVVVTMQAQINEQGSSGNLIPNSLFPAWSNVTWVAPNQFASSSNEAYLPYGVRSAASGYRAGQWAAGSQNAGWGPGIPVVAGRFYCFSAYINVHRCRIQLYVEWKNAADQVIGRMLTPVVGPTGQAKLPLDQYNRPFVIGKAPIGAVQAVVFYLLVGTGELDPFYWMWYPMFSEVADGATKPPTFSASGAQATAQWGVSVRADKKIGGVQLSATGEISAFDVLAEVFRVSSPSNSGQRTEYSDGHWRCFYPNGQLATRMGWWQ